MFIFLILKNDAEISAYTYEKTLKLHEREKLIKEMKLKERKVENEPQIVMDRARRNSIIKNADKPESISDHMSKLNPTDAEINSENNQYTFSPTKDQRRPSIFQTETIRKMHSAVELNKKVLEKSKDASLVLMNIAAPPKISGSADYNCNF